MAATVHGKVRQRATAVDRKVVFRSVLDNPFKIPWPHVPLNVQNVVVAALVTVLAGVAEYHLARQTASRKRKRPRHDKTRRERANAKRQRRVDNGNNGTKNINTEAGSTSLPDDMNGDAGVETAPTGAEDIATDLDAEGADTSASLPVPAVFPHLTFGINEVTKRLETQSHSPHLRVSVSSPDTAPPTADATLAPLTYVFVCRADVDPPLLIAHLPELVAACNVPSPAKLPVPVYLIPLPRHAEHTLAEAVGLRRVSVLALDSTTPSLATLASLLSSVQPPSAPWLTSHTTSHIPTHIKQLRTTAPRDMRTAKHERKIGRQAAKEKQQEKDKSKQDGQKEIIRKEKTRKKKIRKEKKHIKITASTSALR